MYAICIYVCIYTKTYNSACTLRRIYLYIYIYVCIYMYIQRHVYIRLQCFSVMITCCDFTELIRYLRLRGARCAHTTDECRHI